MATTETIGGVTYVRGTWEDILRGTWATGAIAVPFDAAECSAVFGGSTWSGFMGVFGSLSSLSRLGGSAIAVGTTARTRFGGDDALYTFRGTAGWCDTNSIPSFPSASDIPSGVNLGPTINVGGVVKTWDGGGYSPRSATTYPELIAQPNPTIVTKASLPRLCGHGYFEVMWNLMRWAVSPGETIITDAGVGTSKDGYDITAAGTSFVSLTSYIIPAGMIGDGEEWFATAQMRNNGTWTSGSDTVQVRFQALAGNGALLGTAAASAASRVARGEGRFTRLGTTLIRNTGGVTYSNASSADQTLDLSADRVIEAGITPGAIGNTIRLRHWAIGRCA